MSTATETSNNGASSDNADAVMPTSTETSDNGMSSDNADAVMPMSTEPSLNTNSESKQRVVGDDGDTKRPRENWQMVKFKRCKCPSGTDGIPARKGGHGNPFLIDQSTMAPHGSRPCNYLRYVRLG